MARDTTISPSAVGASDRHTASDVIDVTRLRVALARLSRRLRRHSLAGLTPTQLAALSTVEQSGPLRLGDPAAAEGIAPETLEQLREEGNALLTKWLAMLSPEQRTALAAALPALEALAEPEAPVQRSR